MKILHIFNEIKFSGAEIMYASAAPLFQKEGFELMAFSTGQQLGEYASEFEDKEIKTYHKKIHSYPFTIQGVRYYINLYKFFKKEKVDILHVHRNDLYFVAVVAWLANIKCIKTQHNKFRNRWFTWLIAVLRRLIIRKVFNTTFQTISESVFNNELNYYKNPSVHINNWYDNKKFYPAKDDSEKQDLRLKLDIQVDAYVIISTGGCSEIKNHHDIIKAIALIDDQIQNLCYLHLGSGHTEKEEKELAKELNVFNSIKFLGNRKEVRDYLIASDVYVMPSKFEGLGNAALEAMACKVPTILFDVPGLRNLIDDNNNGLLIEPKVNELSNKLLYYYQNPQTAKARAKHAFVFANNKFSMEENVRKMLDLYRNV